MGLGAQLIAITPQLPEHSVKQVDERHLSFDLLHDAGNEAAEDFGLRFSLPDDLRQVYLDFGIDLPAQQGNSSWTLPLPARFVVDAEGVIRAGDVDPDYSVRPDPAETLAVLAELAKLAES